MWTEEQLVNDLRDLGLPEGACVLAHVSLRSIGPIAGGAETLVRVFRRVLGPEGTLLVPTFTFAHSDPAGWRNAPTTPEDLERARAEVPVFDPQTTPAHVPWIGVFPEIVRRQPDAHRSDHPVVSFAAIGAEAASLTEGVPFHYPLGSDSPLARLHRHDGWVLLLGVDHTVNTSLHLAEVWANVPYIHRTATLKTGPEEWTVMQGSPECSAGFGKIEPLLRQARLLQRGYIGNAVSQLMRQRQVISMAVALLQGRGSFLLCDNPNCPWCPLAHKFASDQSALFPVGTGEPPI
jgi:aminoglycoside 3-N-acetyltransferase